MDFLIICPFLLALLLSQGSFTDLEKQRVDSGLEICILCSLPLMTTYALMGMEAGGSTCTGKGSETMERGRRAWKREDPKALGSCCFVLMQMGFSQAVGCAECLAWCRSRNGSDAWCSLCSIELGTEHISQSAVGIGITSQKAEHTCTFQCFAVTNWDGGRGLLGLWCSVSSVPQALFAHEEVG